MRNKLLLAGVIAALGAGSLGPAGVAQAKHGADDPPSHDARDDHGRHHARHHHHHVRHHKHARHHHHARHGHGRDDRPGDDHGGR